MVRKIRGAATPCEEALRALPAAGCAKGLGELQLVCATATAGRALRRQLQELSGAPNIEAAAQLVAADAKRPALLPRTLRNAYVLWRPPHCAGGGAAEAADAAPVDEAAAVAEAAVAELGRAVQAALPAAAAILFAPRALGVAKTAEALRRAGFGAAEVLPSDGATAVAAVAAAEAAAAEGGWAAAPVFVASERWGRGLDLGVEVRLPPRAARERRGVYAPRRPHGALRRRRPRAHARHAPAGAARRRVWGAARRGV